MYWRCRSLAVFMHAKRSTVLCCVYTVPDVANIELLIEHKRQDATILKSEVGYWGLYLQPQALMSGLLGPCCEL